jgi:hypothetical protein
MTACQSWWGRARIKGTKVDDFVYDGGDCVDDDKRKLKQGDDGDDNEVEFQTTALHVCEPLDGLEY